MAEITSSKAARVVVPIRSLGQRHQERMAAHLLALDSHDRYLRFGYAAGDSQIRSYVERIDFERDEVFGTFNRKLEIIALAHLAVPHDLASPSCAEFGVSVLKRYRGRGYGARLFELAVIHARNDGVDTLFIHALTENTAMVNIAQKAGAVLEPMGSETDAYLRLPPATLDSRVSEIVEEQLALADYGLKLQAKHIREFLAGVQEVRRGVQDARNKAGR